MMIIFNEAEMENNWTNGNHDGNSMTHVDQQNGTSCSDTYLQSKRRCTGSTMKKFSRISGEKEEFDQRHEKWKEQSFENKMRSGSGVIVSRVMSFWPCRCQLVTY